MKETQLFVNNRFKEFVVINFLKDIIGLTSFYFLLWFWNLNFLFFIFQKHITPKCMWNTKIILQFIQKAIFSCGWRLKLFVDMKKNQIYIIFVIIARDMKRGKVFFTIATPIIQPKPIITNYSRDGPRTWCWWMTLHSKSLQEGKIWRIK